MDGTGKLFAEFVNALSDEFEITVASYPIDACRSYSELKESVLSLLPKSDSYALLAESFSSPLAIQCAADNPGNLKALILCAGFANSPLTGWPRFFVSLFAPIVSHFKLPSVTVRSFLIGRDAPETLLNAVQGAVSSVRPRVLTARLRAILACDVRKELPQVSVPILYLRAAEDKLVRAQSMEEILRIRPEMKVICIAGPHLLIQREPRGTAVAVVDYLRQLKGTSITLDNES